MIFFSSLRSVISTGTALSLSFVFCYYRFISMGTTFFRTLVATLFSGYFSTPRSAISIGIALSLVGVLIVSVIHNNFRFAIFVICIAIGLKLSLMYDTTHMPLMRGLQTQSIHHSFCTACLLFYFLFLLCVILYTLLYSVIIKSTTLCYVISKVCVFLYYLLYA